MRLEPDLVHPSLAGVAPALVRHGSVGGLGLPEGPCLVAEAIVALLGSDRMPDEMREYVGTLNAALDGLAQNPALLPTLRRARDAARRVESARSGMACDMALDDLRFALDDAKSTLDERP